MGLFNVPFIKLFTTYLFRLAFLTTSGFTVVFNPLEEIVIRSTGYGAINNLSSSVVADGDQVLARGLDAVDEPTLFLF